MTSEHFDFIDIGTSDFRYTIPEEEQSGIYVEPIIEYLNRIPNYKNCIKENIAISDDSNFVDLYYVPESIIQDNNLPIWFKGCNTINNPHKTVIEILNKRNLNIDDILIKLPVKCMTIEDFFNKHNISSINNLKIDTEGYDCYIVRQILEYMKKYEIEIKSIIFETNLLSSKELIDDTIKLLKENKFKQISRTNIDSEFRYDP